MKRKTLCFGACVFFLLSATITTTLAADNKVVVIPLMSRAKDCPAAAGTATAGPHQMYYSCWYLSVDGATCDKVCADVGGSNQASAAEGEWVDNCAGGAQADVSTWFYNNGNAGGWTGPAGGSTGYHTLGYGYRASTYYGKCSSGQVQTNGTYPGELNNNPNRSIVCACTNFK